LGDGVDAEADSTQVDRDLYDDGLTIGDLRACHRETVQVEVAVASRGDPEHPYDAQHLLYLNVLVDWNGDGAWSGSADCPDGSVASEWAVRSLPIDVSSWPEGALSHSVNVELSVGPLTGEVWARLTLSYGEVISGDEWDGTGLFTYGETEDHLLTISAPPPASPEVEISTPEESGAPSPAAGPPGPAVPWTRMLCPGAGLLVLGLLVLLVLLALKRRSWPLALIALALAAGLIAVAFVFRGPASWGLGVPDSLERVHTPSATPEPLVPTATATSQSVGGSGPPVAEATPGFTAAAATPTQVTPAHQVTRPLAELMPARERFGFGVAIQPVYRYEVSRLNAGWYLTWSCQADPSPPEGLEFAQMVRVRAGQASPSASDLGEIARRNPGALWLVGNEPDVSWQDNSTPEEYARAYHEVHSALKGADPTCQVAIGGVSQATPLRLQYLDRVVEAYETLYGQMIPVDVWNVHGFILREERSSWGVGTPPGIPVDKGRLFEMEDHDSMEIFQEQIVAFRRWMKDKGEREKPLIVSEYGVLMPADYGFPEDRVRDFMYATFDFFLTAIDSDLGYPADGNRLVQRWAWYSLSDTVYPTGNLFEPTNARITPLGLAYGSYVLSH